MNGPNRKNTILYINIFLGIAYIALIGFIVFQYFQFPKLYQEKELAYIDSITEKINTVIQDPSKINEATYEEIMELRSTKPFELIVQTNESVLLKTIDLEIKDNYIGSIDSAALVYEEQGFVQNNSIMVWVSIYQMNDTSFVLSFLESQNVVYSVALIVLLTLIFVLQYFMFRPLRKVANTITLAQNTGLDAIGMDAQDNVNEQLNAFVNNIRTSMSQATRKYTDLEIRIQYEKERLNNTFLISKALVHNLKSPTHAVIMQNEISKDANPFNPPIQDITTETIQNIENVIKDINTILQVMNNGFENYSEIEQFNVLSLVRESTQTFKPILENKSIFLDLVSEGTITLHQNVVYFRLLIYNLLSNAILYANEASEVIFEVSSDENTLRLRVKNSSSKEDIERLLRSEDLFSPNENQKYSSGNGLFLIKDLTELMKGTYHLEIEEETVIIRIELPVQENEV